MSAPSPTELLIYGYIRYIESEYKLHRKMAKDIKRVCIQYVSIVFSDSGIIDIVQGMELQNLLSDRISFDETILLYDTSMHKTDVESFYKETESHHPTVIIIKSNHGNIFGGFTKIAWKAKGYNKYYEDKDACLFVLKSDQKDQDCEIFDVCQESSAINFGGVYNRKLLCHFGSPAGLCLYTNFDQYDDNFCYGGDACSYWLPKGNILCGGNQQDLNWRERYQFRVVSLEVFELTTFQTNSIINSV